MFRKAHKKVYLDCFVLMKPFNCKTIYFFSLGLTPHKAEQPQRDMELQEQETQKG